jgi:hypothetical protein
MNRTLFLAAMAATSAWASTTYTFSSSNYSTLTNFTSCVTGPCANYTAAMSLSGSFTIATALPPNFNVSPPGAIDLTPQLISYSFSDGINTYANTNPNTRIYQFVVTTDSAGNINVSSILLELWQSGSLPHSVGDRVSLWNSNGPSINVADNDLSCTSVGGGTSSGMTDVCLLAITDTSSSSARATQGSWTGGGTGGGGGGGGTPPTTVPTLGEWGMIILTGLLVGFAWLRLRRQDRLTPGI